MFSVVLQAQPDIQWQLCLGGLYEDHVEDMVATTDGAYLTAGYTYSSDGDVVGQQGEGDGRLVKLDANGSMVWQRCLGGSFEDKLFAVVATPDGGCLAAGHVVSNDGDVSGHHGLLDAWLVRLDGTGTLLWQRCLGGSGNDAAYALAHTDDGGFIVAGRTDSQNGDVVGVHGVHSDGWVVKLDAQGSIQWQRCLGGAAEDGVHDVLVLGDGSIVVALSSGSIDGDVTAPLGDVDGWLVKLDTTGAITWDVSVGGVWEDYMVPSLVESPDGGFAMLGSVAAGYGFPGACPGPNRELYLVRFDATGDQLWHHCYGGPGNDDGIDLVAMPDGGFVLAGTVQQAGCDVSSVNGVVDCWLARVDATGTLLWERAYGGSLGDVVTSLIPANGGGWGMGGYTLSDDGDVVGQHGDTDGWVVQLGADDVGMDTPTVPSILFWQDVQDRQIHVVLPEWGGSTWWVTDGRGALVAKGTIPSRTATLNLNEMSAGAYWMTFQVGGDRTTRLFILE